MPETGYAEVEEVEESPSEILVPSSQSVKYTFGEDGHLNYTQRPLSFFGKMELFSVLGTAVEGALKDGGFSVSELIDDTPGGLDEFKEADNFIRSIARIAQYVPDLLKDLYVIALAVPRDEREYVKTVMERPADEGGLTDEQGIQILEVFIDQNWDVLVDFFKKQVLPLVGKLTTTSQESQPSKPSKATRRHTPKE